MIDIHCHLLPNIDDGPDTWAESLDLARLCSEEGVEIAVTTPHWIKGSGWEPEPELIKSMVDELNEKLEKSTIPLSVLPGMEVGIAENLINLLHDGEILTIGGGSYILLETPFISIPYGTEEIIFGLKGSGVIPIFAHPERCLEIQSSPKRLNDLLDTGALIQVTTSSILGFFGRSAKECAIRLAKEGLIHLFASDAHSPTNRPPIINKAYSALDNIIGQENTNALKLRASQITKKILDNNTPMP